MEEDNEQNTDYAFAEGQEVAMASLQGRVGKVTGRTVRDGNPVYLVQFATVEEFSEADLTALAG